MRYQDLLKKSQEHFDQFSIERNRKINFFIFRNGAEWMLERMNELDERERVFDASFPFEKYGYFKYVICLSVFLMSAFFLFYKAMFLVPLAILLFYFLEIHFLFLFPLMIDKVEKPILTSIQMTYKIGVFQTLITVIPIGFYMLIGMFNLRNPLRNWYLGCMSILIWYEDERN